MREMCGRNRKRVKERDIRIDKVSDDNEKSEDGVTLIYTGKESRDKKKNSSTKKKLEVEND